MSCLESFLNIDSSLFLIAIGNSLIERSSCNGAKACEDTSLNTTLLELCLRGTLVMGTLPVTEHQRMMLEFIMAGAMQTMCLCIFSPATCSLVEVAVPLSKPVRTFQDLS